jgi:hypothetical protein
MNIQRLSFYVGGALKNMMKNHLKKRQIYCYSLITNNWPIDGTSMAVLRIRNNYKVELPLRESRI